MKSTTDREAALARLISELSDRATRGELIDLERVKRDHPDLAEEVQHLMGAVMVADAVGSCRFAEAAETKDAEPVDIPPASLPLPAMFGDYELLEEIGRGGMGIVYRARQQSLNRIVAVKMLLRGQLASPVDEARFRAEAESAARLQHPGIVPVYEVGKRDGRLFFSMQYVPGQTLAQLLKDGPLERREAARILSQAAHAIHYAHQRGVLHRDLKPSNILIDQAGEVHVMDFGLAQRVTDSNNLTRTGAVLGTPTYMSPEQAAGSRGAIGPASDVYSLGSVLYHTVAGRPPFQAASPVDVVLLVLEQEPLSPRIFNPKADRDLSMIALRCLQKPADLRYDSAGALAEDLDAFLADEPVSARSGRLSQIAGRWLRETHHAVVLQNWGLLWIWHGLALFVVCALTNLLQALGDQNRVHYFLLWTAGLGAWAAVFWWLRQRMGPVTFVERQIAHIWAASMISIGVLFPVEYLLDLPVLKLTPVLGLSSGMVFLVKAGMLTGSFYMQAAALFLSSLAMARWPSVGHLIFGTVSAFCFIIPGLKYYRQRQQRE